jgi:hypothetical protein
VCRLHSIANDLHSLSTQRSLSIGGDAGHLLERRVEQVRFRCCIDNGSDGCIAPFHGDARRREATLGAGTHLLHVLAKKARHLTHLRNPVAIVLHGPE